MKHTFNIDTEQRIWHRHTVTIEAETYEDALSKVIQMAECSDVPDSAIYERLDDRDTDTGRIIILDDESTDEVYANF